jgi:hypothetical protein
MPSTPCPLWLKISSVVLLLPDQAGMGSNEFQALLILPAFISVE